MAERTTRRRKKKENTELEKPTKEETAVARHLRFNLPTKNTSIDGHKVEYFTGSKAVDFLLDSKWATGKGKTEIIFTGRESVANYLDGLLWKGLFYRALKVVKKSKKEGKEKEESKKEKKAKKEKKKTEAEPAEKGDEKEKEKEETKGDVTKETKDGGKEDSPPAKKKEGKKKIKLELTDDQKFVDGNDAFVWVYDPVRPMNYVYGLGLVIGAIAVCLFPLWPPWMRTGTYYLCLCGAGFVGAIFALAIIRLIIFVLTWGATFGKIHFWLFPNLLADVGIKESFIPFYEVDYVTKKEDDKTEKSKDDSNDEKGSETTETEDHPNQEPSQDSGPVENIPENIGDTEDRYSDQAGTPPENSDITEEKSIESGDENEENEDEDDEEEEEDEDDDNGEDFEMIDEEEISEVCDGSGGSQKEEEE